MKHSLWVRIFCALGAALFLLGAVTCALGQVVITITDTDGSTSSITQNSEIAAGPTAQPQDEGDAQAAGDTQAAGNTQAAGDAQADTEGEAALSPEQTGQGGATQAREDMISGIIEQARKEFNATAGKAQEAQYSSSIFICKNFTVYLFRTVAEKYRMAEYPDVKLVIPDNLPKDQCKDYVYGVEWKEIPASEGNPFYVAAQFRYDAALSKEENQEKAREFLKQAKRGDYFQMAANYYYGVGAHSMIFIEDYDPAEDMVRWTDSNMKGEKRKGVRYAYVQFNAEKKIDWFVDAFCRKKYGATIYRLRDDIIPAP